MQEELLTRLRERLAQTEDPVLKQMLEDRIAEVSEPGRTPYQRVRDELERIYVKLRMQYDTGPQLDKRWTADRRAALRHHGWSEDEFYAEMDRRRYQQEKP